MPARFVDRDNNWKSPEVENTFAATLPLESLKCMWSQFQTRRSGPSRAERTILVLDASRAHFPPKSRRELYTRLVAADSKRLHVGKLLRTQALEAETHPTLEFFNNAATDQGYDSGPSSPCLYHDREEDSHGWRHGDDLVFDGEGTWLDDLQKGWNV